MPLQVLLHGLYARLFAIAINLSTAIAVDASDLLRKPAPQQPPAQMRQAARLTTLSPGVNDQREHDTLGVDTFDDVGERVSRRPIIPTATHTGSFATPLSSTPPEPSFPDFGQRPCDRYLRGNTSIAPAQTSSINHDRSKIKKKKSAIDAIFS